MWYRTSHLVALLLSSYGAAQSFSLYPTVDPSSLAQAFNITLDCLDALNTTLPCDQTLFQMANTVDNYFWETDNITSLCINKCMSAVEAWNDDVQNRCVYDSIVAYNKIVPASSITGRFSEGLNIACLTNGNSTIPDLDFAWCLIESQDWVGSDVVRPDCNINPSDPSCTDPTNVSPDNQRLANLYGNDVLCSECFIQMIYQRLISPYLPDHDYSDYLIQQYQDILDVCNATNNMPELVIRAPPNYSTASPPPLNFSSVPIVACTGQTIVTSTLDPSASCNTISQAFNVATGDVQAATKSTVCASTESSFCLPAPCTLQQVPNNATCDSLASSFSTVNLTISTIQLLNWNPNINGLCDSLKIGDFVCSGPPGGSYIPPPPPPGSSNDNGQQRGGGDGSNVGPNTMLLCTSKLPSLTQAGIVAPCAKYCQAPALDYCFNFAHETNITTDQLYSWNPILGQGGSNCTTQFQLGYYYCVAGPGSTTSVAPVPTTTAPVIPSPTQPGISPKCSNYAIAVSGDYCYQFASEHNITTDNLYAWNTVLGSGGSNCVTGFQAGYYYCIGVSS